MASNSRAPNRDPATERRLSVSLLPKVSDELNELLTLIAVATKSDAINRAISVYTFIAQQLAMGNDLLIRDRESGEIEKVRLL